MTVEYITKDITTIEEGVIAHGVNAQRVMGSGVALAIRNKWPIVYERYLQFPSGEAAMGMCDIVEIEPKVLYVANCYTQLFYGYHGRFADPKSIETSIWDAYAFADYLNLSLYLPKIGAGRGGLDWTTEVEPIVEKADRKWPRVDTYICVFEE